jgi:TonB family protein
MTSVQFAYRLKAQHKGGLNMFKMRMKNVVAIAFVLVVTAIYGAAQDPNRANSQTTATDAKAILNQVAETYKNLRSYHFEGRYTLEQVIESVGLKDEIKREELFVNAAIKPDRSRIESKNTHISVTSVSDGKAKWVYAPGPNEYTKTEEGPVRLVTSSPVGDSAPMAHLANATNLLDGYSRVADRLGEAKIIGEETLEIGGRRSDCFVIEAYYFVSSTGIQSNTLTRKYWIDKSRNIVLREIRNTEARMQWGRTIRSKMTYTFTVARVGEPIPDNLFTFVPPQGAKEVAELMPSQRPAATPRPTAAPRPAVTPRSAAPRAADLVGKDAIAFALEDLDGNRVDLQSLKGKVALLDFWASWCGPCVAELPHIEKLHTDLKDRGLIVLGVNNEDAEVARAFVKRKGYTFTTLVDEGREVTMKYGVSGIPQVFIIDRDGKVKWHTLGYGPGKEFELRSAVEKVLKDLNPPSPASARAGAPVSPDEKVRLVVYPSGDRGVSLIPSSGTVESSAGVLGEPTKKVMPHYPPEAKNVRAQGTVQVEITVSESGKVIEAKAISGHELLRDAAVEAAKQWEFKPTAGSGAPVRMQGVVTFSFGLQ